MVYTTEIQNIIIRLLWTNIHQKLDNAEDMGKLLGNIKPTKTEAWKHKKHDQPNNN